MALPPFYKVGPPFSESESSPGLGVTSSMLWVIRRYLSGSLPKGAFFRFFHPTQCKSSRPPFAVSAQGLSS